MVWPGFGTDEIAVDQLPHRLAGYSSSCAVLVMYQTYLTFIIALFPDSVWPANKATPINKKNSHYSILLMTIIISSSYCQRHYLSACKACTITLAFHVPCSEFYRLLLSASTVSIFNCIVIHIMTYTPSPRK